MTPLTAFRQLYVTDITLFHGILDFKFWIMELKIQNRSWKVCSSQATPLRGFPPLSEVAQQSRPRI
ncbi:MAG: hypothetical protein V7K86_10450 [Nostoc sp.]